jgi:hypothetical protein
MGILNSYPPAANFAASGRYASDEERPAFSTQLESAVRLRSDTEAFFGPEQCDDAVSERVLSQADRLSRSTSPRRRELQAEAQQREAEMRQNRVRIRSRRPRR